MAEQLSTVATDIIRGMILRAELIAGTQLYEIQLSEQLNMSRTPIREALTILAQEALLEPAPKRGYKVRAFTGKEIQDAINVRAVLEGYACRALAEGEFKRGYRQKIDSILDDSENLISNGEFTGDKIDEWMRLNYDFHFTMVKATENDVLISLADSAQKIPLASASEAHWYQYNDSFYRRAVQGHYDHQGILSAVTSGQAYRGEALMREHLYAASEFILRYVGIDDVGNSQFPSEPSELARLLPVIK